METRLIFWVTLLSDAIMLVFTVWAAATKPTLLNCMIVVLAMSAFAAALDQVLSRHWHPFTLILTAALNMLLFYRLQLLLKPRGRNIQ